MKKIVFLLAFFAFSLSYAQNSKIEGVILDGEFKNEPLAFASVSIKETNQTITSDLKGRYSLNVTPGTYTLVFNFIGYENIYVENVVVKNEEVVKMDEILKAKQISYTNDIALKQ